MVEIRDRVDWRTNEETQLQIPIFLDSVMRKR
jgi:hypothetical protein